MKRERKLNKENVLLYKKLEYDNALNDTRFYGVFIIDKIEKKIKIDPKRYVKDLGLDEEQLEIINKRKGHYFIPKKKEKYDYNCNVFIDKIEEIKKDWNNKYKLMIKREIDRIDIPKILTAGDSYNLNCGIIGPNSANAWAQIQNYINKNKYLAECASLIMSLYSQFFHMMVSQIEAVTVRVLTKEKAIEDKFDRNVLYATACGKEKSVSDLEHFKYYDRMYLIWNFIKHNNLSTYNKLYKSYPNIIYKDKKYIQGDLAINYIKFDDELIDSTLDGCIEFFKEYCGLVFNEDYNEAQWNYSDYFLENVYHTVKEDYDYFSSDFIDDFD